MDKKSYCIAWLMLLFVGSLHAQYRTTTYCNPLNLDYTYPFHNSHLGKSYRSGADPAVVEFRGEYYMFVTRSWGYWHSKDLLNWDFITPEKWYFEGCNAPAAHNYKDSVLYVCGNPSGAMSILYTDNPKRGDWKAVPSVLHDLQDPALFIDDDERAYMYWGSSNRWPIRGKELDMKNKFLPIAKKPDSLLFLRPDIYGWERFGENHTSDIKPFIEGAWMTKHNGKYYLQYAAPGTQFNVYGDGVYVGKSPLGPFEYAAHNPFCYKEFTGISVRFICPLIISLSVGFVCFLHFLTKTVRCTPTLTLAIILIILPTRFRDRRQAVVSGAGCCFLMANP